MQAGKGCNDTSDYNGIKNVECGYKKRNQKQHKPRDFVEMGVHCNCFPVTTNPIIIFAILIAKMIPTHTQTQSGRDKHGNILMKQTAKNIKSAALSSFSPVLLSVLVRRAMNPSAMSDSPHNE